MDLMKTKEVKTADDVKQIAKDCGYTTGELLSKGIAPADLFGCYNVLDDWLSEEEVAALYLRKTSVRTLYVSSRSMGNGEYASSVSIEEVPAYETPDGTVYIDWEVFA